MDIKREDPPQLTRGGRPASQEDLEIVAALRNDPGQFYRVYELDDAKKASSLAQTIRKGERAAYRDGTFDATMRTVDGKGVVYVKYVQSVD